MITDFTDEALKARRAYDREWRRRNPEKVRAKNVRYWAKRAAKAAAAAEKEKNADE